MASTLARAPAALLEIIVTFKKVLLMQSLIKTLRGSLLTSNHIGAAYKVTHHLSSPVSDPLSYHFLLLFCSSGSSRCGTKIPNQFSPQGLCSCHAAPEMIPSSPCPAPAPSSLALSHLRISTTSSPRRHLTPDPQSPRGESPCEFCIKAPAGICNFLEYSLLCLLSICLSS